MKFAKKFMVVPYIKLQENPDDKFVSDLDRDIGDILIDEKLATDEKVKLYNIALQKFNMNYNPKPISNEAVALNKISEHFEDFLANQQRDKNENDTNNEQFNLDANTNPKIDPNDEFLDRLVEHIEYAMTSATSKKKTSLNDLKLKQEKKKQRLLNKTLSDTSNSKAHMHRSPKAPKKTASTRSRIVSPLVKGIDSNRAASILNTTYAKSLPNNLPQIVTNNDENDDDSQMEISGVYTTPIKSPTKRPNKNILGNGIKTKNSSSKTFKSDIRQQWNCSKTGYFN